MMIWGGRANDFETGELLCFYENLPDHSATKKAQMGLDVELPTYIVAVLIDVINSIAAGLGGKKLKAEDKLTNIFKKNSETKNKKAKGQTLAAKLRAKREALAKAAESPEAVASQEPEEVEAAPQMIPTTTAMDVAKDLRKVASFLKDSDLDALRKASTLGSESQIEDA
jgi:hypothetical protein